MGIIIKPIVTEKMTAMGEKYNRYGFRVDPKADKLQIKKAVEEMYNVTVVSVNTMNYRGKNKSRYTKTGLISGRTAAYKKALVTLKEGETLTKVALRFYGTKALWPYLVKHNSDLIKNPDNVPSGVTIKIPKLEKKAVK